MSFILNPFTGRLDKTGGTGGGGGPVPASDVTPIDPSVLAELGTANDLDSVLIELANRSRIYIHTQAVASLTWAIPHGLDISYPQVQPVDSTNTAIWGFQLSPVDSNNLNLIFERPFSGSATIHR